MPSFVDDRLVPGSERAVEIVGDRLMRDIVKDFRHGPARLPLVHPDAPRPAESAPQPALKPPPGVPLIDKMCLGADAQERLVKIEALSRAVATLQAGYDNKVKRLEEEIARLQGLIDEQEKVKKNA